MQNALLVFLGAGVGGVLRHGVNLWMPRLLGAGFPYATLFINISGSFLIGMVAGWFALRAGMGADAAWHPSARLFLTTGILGGYTTFSTFSLEFLMLVERHETGLALLYVASSVLVSLLAVACGVALVRALA